MYPFHPSNFPALLAHLGVIIICQSDLVCLSSTKFPRVGPSVLQSHVDDEDFIISSGSDWGSGSGEMDLDRFRSGGGGGGDDEDFEDLRTSRLPKVTIPPDSRISCVVCSGDASCRDPYIRNSSHIQPCQSSVEGCLKVVTPSGDTYRNCLYGIFEKAEKTTGCHVIKEDMGHKFTMNATICICHSNVCNIDFLPGRNLSGKTSAISTDIAKSLSTMGPKLKTGGLSSRMETATRLPLSTTATACSAQVSKDRLVVVVSLLLTAFTGFCSLL